MERARPAPEAKAQAATTSSVQTAPQSALTALLGSGNRTATLFIQRTLGAAAAATVRTAITASPPTWSAVWTALDGLGAAQLLVALEALRDQPAVGLLTVQSLTPAPPAARKARMTLALAAAYDQPRRSLDDFFLLFRDEIAAAPASDVDTILCRVSPHWSTYRDLLASAGFAGLAPAEQTRLRTQVGGLNLEISVPSLAALAAGVADGSVVLATTASVRQFMTTQPGIQDTIGTPDDRFDGRRAAFTTEGPTAVARHPFVSGPAAAQHYVVVIGATRVDVFLPATAVGRGLHQHGITEIASSLAMLPAANLSVITRVNVEPAANPSDAYWARRYHRRGFRSYMTAGASGVVSVYPSTSPVSPGYRDGTAIHETGHTLSNLAWGEATTDRRWRPWKGAITSDALVPSTYARSSPAEDVAEALVCYQQTLGTPAFAELQRLMPARFAILEDLLAHPPIRGGAVAGASGSGPSHRPPPPEALQQVGAAGASPG